MDWKDRTSEKILKIPLDYNLSMDDNVKHLSDWIKTNNQKYDIRYAVMYHAANKDAPVLEKGILAGNGKRKNFGMSESGYVYLATTPKMAEMFGSMVHNKNFTVYEVIVPIGKLMPDKNRLQFTALEGAKGNKLAQSLIYANSAKVKGDIERWQVKPYENETEIIQFHAGNNGKENDSMSKYDISAKVNPLSDQSGKVKAMASITIDNVIAINSLTIVEGNNGHFVGYPQNKDKDGNFRDIVEFLKDENGKTTKEAADLKNAINKLLVDMYKNNERSTPAQDGQTKELVMHEIKAFVTPLRDSQNATKGLGTVQVGEMFKINSIRVNENSNTNEKFVAMPSRPDKSAESGYRDIVHPVNKEFRENLVSTVLKQFDNQQQWKNHMANKEQTQTAQREKPATNKSAPNLD